MCARHCRPQGSIPKTHPAKTSTIRVFSNGQMELTSADVCIINYTVTLMALFHWQVQYALTLSILSARYVPDIIRKFEKYRMVKHLKYLSLIIYILFNII